MLRRRINAAITILAASVFGLAVAGCDAAGNEGSVAPDAGAKPAAHCDLDLPAGGEPSAGAEPPPGLGLMTSLPLTYPLGADFAAFARGEVQRTWQAAVLAQCFSPFPLDTLAPLGGLGPDLPATNPLSGIEYLAVIQPRGLSPRDNVALDDWVRAGGKLLLVLDPMLTGEYDLPLGDPRRPGAVAFMPPVVERWGMAVTFDEAQAFEPRRVDFGERGGAVTLPVLLAGEITVSSGDCLIEEPSPVQQCSIGKGTVTLVADAAVFEDQSLAAGAVGQEGAAIHGLLRFAFGG